MKKLISCIRIEWQQADKKKSAMFLSSPVFQDRHTVQHISQKRDNGKFEFDYAENMAKTRDITVYEDGSIVVGFEEPSFNFAKDVLSALQDAGYEKKQIWIGTVETFRIKSKEYFDESFLTQYAR